MTAKSIKRTKRDTGGLVIYCQNNLAVKRNDKGIMWVKFEHTYFSLDKDIIFCLTYIAPEKSNLCSNISLLGNFDFFDCLSDETSHYTYLGDVYLCADLNCRTGSLFEFLEEIGLDRFVDLIPPRGNCVLQLLIRLDTN